MNADFMVQTRSVAKVANRQGETMLVPAVYIGPYRVHSLDSGEVDVEKIAKELNSILYSVFLDLTAERQQRRRRKQQPTTVTIQQSHP